MIRNLLWRMISLLSLGLLAFAPGGSLASVVAHAASVPVHGASSPEKLKCNENAVNCAEVSDPINYDGKYTGHDEPSLLFYSNVPGSGNSNVYHLTLPKDPPTLPNQTGTGGTFNFQLHPAFWFGMALCDSQSAPNPGQPCNPTTDANIFDGSNTAAADYVGKHPGTAFLELQFYPPGWAPAPAGNSCDATQWCAAMAIFSLSQNQNTGQSLNATCQGTVGLEYANYAFVTKSGIPHAPANPVDSTLDSFTPHSATDLFMNSGDKLVVRLNDTPSGIKAAINDQTTGATGSMTASAANTFGQVKFAPDPATSCDNIPYDFHAMYATSSEHTRVPWAAHSYNVAFSDEIGHFEYCPNVNPANGHCTSAGASDPAGPDADDVGCFSPAESLLIPIGGCQGTDTDFDGVAYQRTWPGSLSNRAQDKKLNPQPILFSSPLFKPSGGEGGDNQTGNNQGGGDNNGNLSNYKRVAFEADLPRIENATNPPCQRHVSNPADPNPGQGCVNPPVGANFYPIFTTRGGGDGGDNQTGNNQRAGDNGSCLWQLGGANIPGTTHTFGGNSTTEYGPLLLLAYPTPTGVTLRYNDFRRVLSSNPCQAQSGN